MLSPIHLIVLFAAGIVAGIVGTAGGITSMISYPALLVVGVPALPAGITNNVALVACWPGSAFASRPELDGRGRWLRRWAAVAVLGSGIGALLLLATPPKTFSHIVPFLVGFGALALWLEPRLTAWRERRGLDGSPLLAAGLLATTIYNGYFGAGSGVLVLTLMLLLVERDLLKANALKNMLIGGATLCSAAIFALSGTVSWSAVLPLALGSLIGSSLGPRVARYIPPHVLRYTIVVLGLALAVQLWFDPRL